MSTDKTPTIHHGHNIKRLRDVLGIKQEALALELGDDWTQKKVSLLEQKETVDDDLLEQVAKIFKVSPQAIKEFNEDSVINYFNTFNDTSKGEFNNHCTFNPLDKLVEVYEENRKLYEALLKSEREKIALLERMVGGK